MSRSRRLLPETTEMPPPVVIVLCVLGAVKMVVVLAGAVALLWPGVGVGTGTGVIYGLGLLAVAALDAALVWGLWHRRRWAWLVSLPN